MTGQVSLRAERGNPVAAQAQLLDRRVAFLLAMTGEVSLRAERGNPVAAHAQLLDRRAPFRHDEPACVTLSQSTH